MNGHTHEPSLLAKRVRVNKYAQLVDRLAQEDAEPLEKVERPRSAWLEKRLDEAFGEQSEIARQVDELQDRRPPAQILPFK